MNKMPFVLLGLSLTSALLATEVDNYTHTYEYLSLNDSRDKLNQLTNNLLREAASLANLRSNNCSENELYDAIEHKLGTNPWAVVEDIVSRSPEFDRLTIERRQSIYRYLSIFEAPALYVADLGAIVRIDRHLIGTDKIGHFLQQGYEYFQIAYLENDLYMPKLRAKGKFIESTKAHLKTLHNIAGRGIRLTKESLFGLVSLDPTVAALQAKEADFIGQAINYGIDLEEGIYGLGTTAIKSYADLVANYNGMIWWTRLTGLRARIEGSPYFTCKAERWQLNRPMDWLDYVDDLWNESVNCSSYANPAATRRVMRGILNLKDDTGRSFHCPTKKEACVQAKKYEPFTAQIVNLPCDDGSTL